MPFTMKTKLILCILAFAFVAILKAQEGNAQSSSPYSLYGLGVYNENTFGMLNARGKLGFAIPSLTAINPRNPASFGNMRLNTFMLDIGFQARNETIINSFKEENQFNANFSNIGFAFPLSEKSGLAITLTPFTNVGYLLTGLENSIEGSVNSYFSDVSGEGGLNNFQVSYGYGLTNKLRLGITMAYLFGTIKETETNYIDTSVLVVDEENYYGGFRFEAGLQYDITENVSIGAVASLPTYLRGSQTKTIETFNTEVLTSIEEEEQDIEDFKFPFEVGFGTVVKLFENKLSLNADYKRSFWDATNQSDYLGDYKDQNIFAVGASYRKNARSQKYWDRIFYNVGFNYDNGYLKVNDASVNNYSISAGLGLPLSKRTNTMLYVSYSYGQRGQVSNGLIKENYHTIGFNLSFDGNWFKKRKIN